MFILCTGTYIDHHVGGYLNDSGLIDTKRLQVILDEMAQWEQEVFEKEYADLNWYKGKQSKNAKELERTRNNSKLGGCGYIFEVYPAH